VYTLPHQFEFFSDAWLEESRRFLAERFAQQASDMPDGFVLSECFTDAPPHLGFDDNEATWEVTWDGKSLDVSRGFNPKADIVIRGDYQATLMMAQTVGAGSQKIMADVFREMTNWFGQGAFTMDIKKPMGELPTKIFALHHDHMARRTVENPDLAHRAGRQGLSQHIRDMEEHGYAVIENAISPTLADQLRDSTINALSTHQNDSMQWMLYHGDAFEKVVMNPQLMSLIDASLGRGAIVASISSIKRGPGKGLIPLHTDYAQVPEPYPEFSLTGVGVWAMEDWTEASGPTWLVPGSHRKRRPPKPGEKMDGVPIEMPKGSVVYFQHGVWHWQGDRTAPGERVTLHSHFNRGILRPLEPMKIDVQMLNRNPPRLGEALGEDDWFDKIDRDGRDYQRFAHMNQLNRFTDEKKAEILAG
jgi:ectoine hydroxylase-related dioxygenase (phytanoyl-CoA dioxygenase family)